MLDLMCVTVRLCGLLGSVEQTSAWSGMSAARSMTFQPCPNPCSLGLRILPLPRSMWYESSPRLLAWFSGWASPLALLHRPGTR